MIEYENTSHTTVVVVVDGKLRIIEPREKIKARNVVYTPSLTEIKKVESPPKIQKKRVTNASKTKN
tara:strand:- start:794 stop:991 length:198 start_codon:yes stop_codon:yes gene_type:complete